LHSRFRLPDGGHFEDFECCAEAKGGVGGFVVQYLRKDGDGLSGEVGGLVGPVVGSFARGKFEFTGEGGDGATPVGDGVAVDVDGGSRFRNGRADREQAEDAVLGRGESGVGRKLGFALHR
jgi:hypothetical protein